MTRIFLSEKHPNQCSPNFVRNPSCSSGTNCDSSVLEARTRPGLTEISQRGLLIFMLFQRIKFLRKKYPNQCSPNFVRNPSCTSGTNCGSSVLEAETKPGLTEISQRGLLIFMLFQRIKLRRRRRLFNVAT
ncbi:hypothetical protein CDAR_376891 [Caerostris darwini]|uniref:Uncharacterized protein n=1 Tax=Caerostris darwini TaxID=1538125 RepID=A0AAV4SWN0_9ARAC|nr:hypothetical protein CDAR_376891 [Caerostris darwini]